jgi:hypothetical protein
VLNTVFNMERSVFLLPFDRQRLATKRGNGMPKGEKSAWS